MENRKLPVDKDGKETGDGHLRCIKRVPEKTFPDIRPQNQERMLAQALIDLHEIVEALEKALLIKSDVS